MGDIRDGQVKCTLYAYASCPKPSVYFSFFLHSAVKEWRGGGVLERKF